MKDDLTVPACVPRKRRALEAAPDLFLAVWLDGDSLSLSERRRVQAEKDRRKRSVVERTVGVVLDRAGVEPAQLDALRGFLEGAGASRIVHRGVPGRVHGACKASGARVEVLRDDERRVVRESDLLVALPKDRSVMPYSTPGVWALVGSARHRGVAVKVIMPSGVVLEGE